MPCQGRFTAAHTIQSGQRCPRLPAPAGLRGTVFFRPEESGHDRQAEQRRPGKPLDGLAPSLSQELPARRRWRRPVRRHAVGRPLHCLGRRRCAGNHQGQTRLHRPDRRRATVRRRREGLLRQVRHDRRGSAQAIVLGHHPRQHRPRLGQQRHRRRPHPLADALPDQRRHGHAEQPASADVHPRPPQPRRAVHLGRPGICRSQGRPRHHRVQEGPGGEESQWQESQRRDDLPRRHP